MDGSEPASLFKKRGLKKPLVRRRQVSDQSSRTASSSSSDGDIPLPVKRPRRSDGISSLSGNATHNMDIHESVTSKYSADRSAIIEKGSDATKQSHLYDSSEKDRTDQQPSSTGSETLSQNSYKGNANYKRFVTTNSDAPTKQVGPIKAPANVRTVTFTDYSPDVCKDYKLTGFCGFGDSCIFLHSREDYKQGWQLDREWENVTKGKKMTGQIVSSRTRDTLPEESAETTLDGIPFACIICKESYRNPVVTKCGHYFCEACALRRFRKTPNCAACGVGTGGSFSGAKNLKKLLEVRRMRVASRETEGDINEEDLAANTN